jgi:tetratricopeptide (TPR) repeat protein
MLLAGAAQAQTPAPTPASRERARAASDRGDLAAAAAAYEEALAAEPDDEDLYRELSELYDQRGLDYRRALDVHRRYLGRFPTGRFVDLVRGRQATLEQHEAAWEMLRRYRAILQTSYLRDAAENIAAVDSLLREAAGSSLEPEMLLWLASASTDSDRARALGYMQRYSAVGGTRPAAERAEMLSMRANLLFKEKRYAEALASLREAQALVSRDADWPGLESAIAGELRTRWAFRIATTCFVLLLALGLALRPWRAPGFSWQARPLGLYAAGCTLAALLPIPILHLRGLEAPASFPLMAGFALAGVVGVKLLAPLARRLGRPAYLGLALVLVCSCMYMALHLGGNVDALEWPFEAARRGL